jgi:hypothetical protein
MNLITFVESNDIDSLNCEYEHEPPKSKRDNNGKHWGEKVSDGENCEVR